MHELVNTLDCLMYTKSLENKVFSCIFLLFAFSILSVSSVTDYVLLFAIKSLAYRSKVAKFVFFFCKHQLTLQHLFTVHTEHILYILDVNIAGKVDYWLNGTICVWNCGLVGIMDDHLILTTHLRLFYKFSTSLHWRSMIMNSNKKNIIDVLLPFTLQFHAYKMYLCNLS